MVSQIVVPAIVSVLSAAITIGLVPLIQAVRGRGRARDDQARAWVRDFKTEATEARAELGRVRTEAVALADELYRLRLAIFSPTATIDGLRDLVRRSTGPNTNGRP